MHRRCLVACAGVIALLASCGDDGGDTADATTTSSAPTSTESSPTTGTTTTTPVDEAPPELNNTGDDYVAIYESLFEYVNWLAQHPSLEALDVVYEPGSDAFRSTEQIISQLVANGWRWSGPTARNDEVIFGDPIDARSVTVIAVERRVPATLIDVTGAPVPDQPPSAGDGRVLVQLALGSDDRWRIASIHVVERLS